MTDKICLKNHMLNHNTRHLKQPTVMTTLLLFMLFFLFSSKSFSYTGDTSKGKFIKPEYTIIFGNGFYDDTVAFAINNSSIFSRNYLFSEKKSGRTDAVLRIYNICNKYFIEFYGTLVAIKIDSDHFEMSVRVINRTQKYTVTKDKGTNIVIDNSGFHNSLLFSQFALCPKLD